MGMMEEMESGGVIEGTGKREQGRTKSRERKEEQKNKEGNVVARESKGAKLERKKNIYKGKELSLHIESEWIKLLQKPDSDQKF